MKHLAETGRLMSFFRKRDFDAAFIVSARPQPLTYLLGYLSGAGTRIGFAYDGVGNALTCSVGRAPELTPTARKSRLVTLLDRHAVPDTDMFFAVLPCHEEEAHRICRLLPAGTQYLCFSPSSLQPGKQWSAEKWGSLAGLVTRRHGIGIVFCGGEADAPYLDEVMSFAPDRHLCVNATGQLSLGGFAALLRNSNGLVTVDSAPEHFAAALNQRHVILFSGLYKPEDFINDTVDGLVLTKNVNCRGCQKGCSTPCCMDFTVEEVYNALYSHLLNGRLTVQAAVLNNSARVAA